MPRPGRGVPEKSKDFAGSMKRLIENLKPWKNIKMDYYNNYLYRTD